MAETKKALKRIRERITANETEDALKEINGLLQKGVEDYNLYLFAGLAYSSSDSQQAAEYYRKAIAIDAENSQAWKGLYKLDSQEKTEEYRKARTLISVKLGKLQGVTPDELNTAELSKLVLRNFGLKPDSPHVQQLVATASNNLHLWSEFEKDTHLIACKFHCQVRS
ncbi:TPR Domain containing protein [Aphelenchoides avenae]|nr:TPR Domain containing protein [Aphelenchus avenae]